MRKSFKISICLFMFLAVESPGKDMFLIDSLVTELAGQNPDSVQCRILLQLAKLSKTTDTTSAKLFLEQGDN